MSGSPSVAPARSHERLDSLAGEWDQLVGRIGAEPWHRPGWYRAFWRAFGEGELVVATVQREGRLAGVAPVTHHRGGWRAVANWHTPTFSLLAEDEGVREELVERMLDLNPGWLSLPFLDPAEVPAIERAAAAHRYRTLERTIMRSPYIPTLGELDDLWKSGIDIKKRPSELARRRRNYEKAGHVEFVVSDGSEGLEELLYEALPVEASGWKAAQGTAIVSRPDTLQFYTDIAHWAAGLGILRLFFSRLDGRMISFEMCLEDNDRLANLKGGIDPEFKSYSVGVLTKYEMIKYCYEHGLESFESLGAEAPHKREWGDVARDRSIVQAFRSDAVGGAAYAAYAYGRPAAKRALALARR
jgi:CelD/BcsL family acetyltransferase involved in cellulose biosynthesis